MKKLCFTSLLLLGNSLYSQIGINTESPKSTLQIKEKRNLSNVNDTSTTDGLIIPNLTKDELAAKIASAYTQDHIGTLIYVNNAISTSTLDIVSEIASTGYYYLADNSGSLRWRMLPNLYNHDNKLVSNRTVNQDGKTLSFSGGTTVNSFSIEGNAFSVDATSKRIGVGTTTPNSGVQMMSSLSLPIITTNSNYTITANDHTVIYTGYFDFNNPPPSPPVITIPDPSTCKGRIYKIINLGSNGNIIMFPQNPNLPWDSTTNPYIDFGLQLSRPVIHAVSDGNILTSTSVDEIGNAAGGTKGYAQRIAIQSDGINWYCVDY